MTAPLDTCEVLLALDPQAGRYIAGYAGWKPTQGGGGTGGPAAGGADDGENPLRRAVIHGRREEVLERIEKALAEGADAASLLGQ